MPQILETKNYKMFSMAASNRPVKKSHVELLKKAIRKKNLLHLNPIIIDNNGNVIDGQHRLRAAMELKIAIHYMIDEAVSEDDIGALNSNKSNWKPADYISYFASKGKAHYKTLQQFLISYPKLSVSTALALLCQKGKEAFNTSTALREGSYVVNSLDEAVEIMVMVDDFKEFESNHEKAFITALQRCKDSGEYDHYRMMEKMMMCPGKLQRRANADQYVQLLEEIFNFKQSFMMANFRVSQSKKLKAQQIKERMALQDQRKMERMKDVPTIMPSTKVNGVEKVSFKLNDKTTVMAPKGSKIADLKKKYKITD